jgi:hypothetical protein
MFLFAKEMFQLKYSVETDYTKLFYDLLWKLSQSASGGSIRGKRALAAFYGFCASTTDYPGIDYARKAVQYLWNVEKLRDSGIDCSILPALDLPPLVLTDLVEKALQLLIPTANYIYNNVEKAKIFLDVLHIFRRTNRLDLVVVNSFSDKLETCIQSVLNETTKGVPAIVLNEIGRVMFDHAWYFFDLKMYEQAFKCYIYAARRNMKKAQLWYAFSLITGLGGGEKNIEKGRGLLKLFSQDVLNDAEMKPLVDLLMAQQPPAFDSQDFEQVVQAFHDACAPAIQTSVIDIFNSLPPPRSGSPFAAELALYTLFKDKVETFEKQLATSDTI